MSTLTKLFVVLLVVMSLLSSAGFIVFVNRVENFKTSLATANASVTQGRQDLATAKAQASDLLAQVATARRDADDAQKEVARVTNDEAEKVASLQATIAGDQSNATIAQVSTANITAALTASEGQRKAQTDALISARSDLDKARQTASDDDIAISDLTNKNDVGSHKVTDLSEQLAQAKGDNDRYTAQLKELGQSPNVAAPDRVQISAPPINGVVRQTGPINGIPYATISVGSAEQVQKGMVFEVIDRTHGKFLGELTIDSVDLHEATGRLEGPAIHDVRVGTDVRTQL